MEETAYNTRLRAVKLAEKKVKDFKKRFLAQNVVSADIATFNERLKEIRDKLDHYDDLIAELTLDLEAYNVGNR